MTKTFVFGTHFAGKATVTAADLAGRIAAEFGASQTIAGQAFTMSTVGGGLEIVQDAEPQDDSQVVPANLDFEIKVTRTSLRELSGAAETQAAFGSKAVIEINDLYDSIAQVAIGALGYIDASDYLANIDKVLDYMRANGLPGQSNISGNDFEKLRLHYVDGHYHVDLNQTEGATAATRRIIGPLASVVIYDSAGNEVPGAGDFPRDGQYAVLDFGEFGKVKLHSNPGKTFQASHFGGDTNLGLHITQNAPAINGGAIDFSGLDKRKLAQAAKDAGAGKNAASISMKWNEAKDQLELISNGKTVGYAHGSDVIGITGAAKDVTCYALDGTEIGTIKITPGTGAPGKPSAKIDKTLSKITPP